VRKRWEGVKGVDRKEEGVGTGGGVEIGVGGEKSGRRRRGCGVVEGV